MLAHTDQRLSFVLTAAPEVQIANVKAIEMVSRPNEPRIAFEHRSSTPDKSFVWSATIAGWLHLIELIQPFCDGQVGHQYLTEDKNDALLVELSSGEQDVPIVAR
jgi:hypothetical protein